LKELGKKVTFRKKKKEKVSDEDEEERRRRKKKEKRRREKEYVKTAEKRLEDMSLEMKELKRHCKGASE
jgi:hypothetical protein